MVLVKPLNLMSCDVITLTGLADSVAPAPVMLVPFLDADVHDLSGLDRIASHLFAES